MLAQPSRRSFLGFIASLTGALLAPSAAFGARAGLAGARALDVAAGADAAAGPWDLSWLDTLKGKHRQVFSVGTLPGHLPMHVVNNWLNAHREVFGLEPPDVNAIVGISISYPVNAVDALWAKYELGRRWELKDPKTNDWATRNIYLDHMAAGAGETGVRPLQARGVIFWQCNNALNGVAHGLADETRQPFEQVRAELLAGLNPGVRLIPAHTMVLGLAQERGFAYEQIG